MRTCICSRFGSRFCLPHWPLSARFSHALRLIFQGGVAVYLLTKEAFKQSAPPANSVWPFKGLYDQRGVHDLQIKGHTAQGPQKQL